MQVEIDEVVSTIRVTDGAPGLEPRAFQRLVRAVLAAVEDREARAGRRAGETRIPDDGRGGVDRAAGAGGPR